MKLLPRGVSRSPPVELILAGREAIIDRPMSDDRTEILLRADKFQIFGDLIALISMAGTLEKSSTTILI